ncbi:putative integral membrane protein [Caenispirillum salinarum AK4]|uniref:Probable membrane transporter protein n=1 Tax=Caenispirillum salinarum AK4 TaxID=1238182 RepID=K9H179_9PROT|nr:sulfite exporter TauE/SafE family protein [Caenispirillum salinarum]EKV31307.1 putative integral membrane protein [Caenispirillum salinarum AK4]
MITDPWFYAAAVPAVLVAGVSKGGFGGGLGVLAVPLMALTISPVQAAAIMLPILCVMDVVNVWTYRRRWDHRAMRLLIAAAMVGIALGTATFHLLSADAIRLIIGAVALGFTANWAWKRLRRHDPPAAGHNVAKGGFWGAVAGFTSFVAHAGGPPLNVYLLPLKLDKTVYQATTVIFFTAVNYVKLVPYAWLGQLNTGNLGTALVLMPLAPLGIWLGVWAHDRVREDLFYRAVYLFLALTGAKLTWDGIAGMVA